MKGGLVVILSFVFVCCCITSGNADCWATCTINGQTRTITRQGDAVCICPMPDEGGGEQPPMETECMQVVSSLGFCNAEFQMAATMGGAISGECCQKVRQLGSVCPANILSTGMVPFYYYVATLC